MPNRGDTQINTFAKGLNTQVSPLSFPPNTALDILNFRIEKNETNVRRLGIDFEDNYLLTASGYAADVLATARKSFFRWEFPNGNPDVEIGVVQIGAKFFFVNLFAESPSNTLLNGGSAYDTGVDPTSRFSFTIINNYLLALSPSLPQPALVSYDGATDTIITESAPIQIRDFWGVDDGYDIGSRPPTLTPAHHYNLKNQGWSDDIITTCGTGINAINCTFNTYGIYPSNGDHWSVGRIEDVTDANVYKYDPEFAKRNSLDVGFIARGHYVIDLYNRGVSRNTLTGLTLPADIETGRLSTVASYAGRAFYAGIKSKVSDDDARSPIFSGTVFYSQVFVNKIDLVKCYQEADPTGIDFTDIIDTDGGIIQIPECSIIVKLQAIKDSLFVFAQNGIWRIRGDDGGFRATSYQVDKISNVGVYSPDSIVEINGTVYFWGINGIYQLALNQFGIYETNNITIPTIQRLYDSIPDLARIQAKAYYDLNRNSIRWLYYSDEAKVAGEPIEYIAPNTIVSVVAGSTTTLSSILYFDIIGHTEDRFLTAHVLNSALSTVNSRIIDTSGTSISTETTSAIAAEPAVIKTSTGSDIVIISFTDGRVLSIYGTNEGLQRIGAVCASLSGTTYTAGTTVYPYTSSGSSGITFRTVKLTETLVLCVFYDASRPSNSSLRAFVLSLSGTTITVGSVKTLTATSAVNYAIAKVTDSTVLLIWEDGVLGRRSNLITITGTTVSEGTGYNMSEMPSETIRSPVIHMTNAGSGYLQYVASDKLRVRRFTFSGYTAIVNSYLELSSNTVSGVSSNISSVLENDTLISTYVQATTNLPYLNISKVYGADSNTSITPIIDTTISATAVINESESLRLAPYGTDKYAVGFRSTGNVLNFKTYSITV